MNTMQVLNSAINVKQIVGFEPFKANCYIITKGTDAIIVDPCIPYEQAKRLVKNAKIRAVFLTHGHIDHFYYVEEYVTGEIDALYYHPKAYDKLSNTRKSYAVLTPQKTPFTNTSKSHPIEEGMVEVGSFTCQVVPTPGHSNCSICLAIGDYLMTGDTLFCGDVGRTDLYTSSSLALSTSLKRIMTLFPHVIVCPGHDEMTTMEDEIKNNPYLKELL